MGVEILDLSEDDFGNRLASAFSGELAPESIEGMYAHYRELRKWNRRVALVGSGLVNQVVERLFAESLAALRLIDDSDRRVLDVGSGAGFPGLVIAAARPEIRVVLVEPRQRKWAFLRAAAARASLSCTCLNARVSAALPSGIPGSLDRVTARAIRLGPSQLTALSARLTATGSFLVWARDDRGVPDGFAKGRRVGLGAGRGWIQELVVADGRSPKR